MLEPRDRPLFAVLVVLALLLGCLIAVVSFAERPPEPRQQSAQASTNEASLPKKPESKSFWARTVDDPIALYTLVLAIFTTVLGGASIWQGRLTRQSIDFARTNAAAEQRAWLEIKDVRRSGPAKFDGPFVIFDLRISIRNAGASPALNVWADAEMFYPGQAGKMSERWDKFLSQGRARVGTMGNMVVFPRSEDVTQGVILGVPTSFSDALNGLPFALIGVFYKCPGDDVIHESTGSFFLTNIPRDKASDDALCFQMTPSLTPFTAT